MPKKLEPKFIVLRAARPGEWQPFGPTAQQLHNRKGADAHADLQSVKYPYIEIGVFELKSIRSQVMTTRVTEPAPIAKRPTPVVKLRTVKDG